MKEEVGGVALVVLRQVSGGGGVRGQRTHISADSRARGCKLIRESEYIIGDPTFN